MSRSPRQTTRPVTRYLPPGGAGGYQGEVYAVDTDSGDDYLYYVLLND
jgi:hypothetical protein